MTTEVLLSLGSNVGDRKAAIDRAVERLSALPGTTPTARSSYYRTAPVGPVEQPWFLNIAVVALTGLGRADLRAACRAIETELGRDRAAEIPWGPRPIDVDIVAYGAAESIDERAFVLVPLMEIAPDFMVGGRALAALTGASDRAGVEKLDWPVPALSRGILREINPGRATSG